MKLASKPTKRQPHHRLLTVFARSFTVCTGCQSRYASTRARENFEVGQVVMLIPANMGNYRDFSDAAGGPLVLGQQEPIEQVSDNRIRSDHALALSAFTVPFCLLYLILRHFVTPHRPQSARLVVRPSRTHYGIQRQRFCGLQF